MKLADLPITAARRTAIRDELALVVPRLVAIQRIHFAAAGTYFQLHWTHTADPTAATAPDDLDRIATQYRRRRRILDPNGTTDAQGRPATIVEVLDPPKHRAVPWAATTHCRYAVDAYSGPGGHGFVVKARFKGGTPTKVYERRQNFDGPEVHRSSDEWVEMPTAVTP